MAYRDADDDAQAAISSELEQRSAARQLAARGRRARLALALRPPRALTAADDLSGPVAARVDGRLDAIAPWFGVRTLAFLGVFGAGALSLGGGALYLLIALVSGGALLPGAMALGVGVAAIVALGIAAGPNRRARRLQAELDAMPCPVDGLFAALGAESIATIEARIRFVGPTPTAEEVADLVGAIDPRVVAGTSPALGPSVQQAEAWVVIACTFRMAPSTKASDRRLELDGDDRARWVLRLIREIVPPLHTLHPIAGVTLSSL